MSQTRPLLLMIVIILFAAAAPAAAGDGGWVFAYRPGCGDCDRALPLVEAYKAAHPEQPIEFLDLATGPDAVDRFTALTDRYGTRSKIPVLFAGDLAVAGVDEIQSFIAGATPPPGPTPGNATPLAPLTPLAVASAGLVDGINPCAFAVLSLLLGTLSASGTRTRVLALGAAYTLGVFACYLAAGLGIVGAIGAAGLAPVFRIATGIVALVLGPAVLLAAIGLGGAFKPILPARSRAAAARWIGAARTAGPIAALALGIGVGLVELPCTGGIYLGVLGLLSGGSFADALPLLVLYNLCFVLPLALLVGGVAFGLAPSSIDRWRESRRRAVLGLSGLVMIALGAAVLIEVLS